MSTAAGVKVEDSDAIVDGASAPANHPPRATNNIGSAAVPRGVLVSTGGKAGAVGMNPSAIAKRASTAPGPHPTVSPPKLTSKSKKKKASPVVTMATAATAQTSSQGAQGENTGRWTSEEHRLFLQGLELHGKGWKKIASLIKSRTVVQIRTHAQKYFQKLAKARQNGEEGDVAMEGRGGVASVASVSPTAEAQSSKRRRQTTGTKRKAIQSVVSSAHRQAKKMATASAAGAARNTSQPAVPAVAPALAHFLLPSTSQGSQPANSSSNPSTSTVPSITTAQGTISGPALEDSLFRFLSPAPVAQPDLQVNEVARQAGANPITLPSENPSNAPSTISGEGSPTGVADLAVYPSWTDAKDTPSWYSKGSDVDVLLEVGDTLDWLADTGDLHEAYQPPPGDSSPALPEDLDQTKKNDDLLASGHDSSSLLRTAEENFDSVVPPLPSLFDGASISEAKKDELVHTSMTLTKSLSSNSIDEHLQVFDTPMEEHDFVSTILENSEGSESLPVLG